MWWLLAREVLFIKGRITRQKGFVLDDKEMMPDLYFYRDPEEAEKEEQQAEVRDEIKDDRWGQEIAPQPIPTEVSPKSISLTHCNHYHFCPL